MPNSGGETVIRVLLAHNTHIQTQLLADALKRDQRLHIVAAVSHARELVEAAKAHPADVAVISSNLDEEPLRGIAVLREVRAYRPDLHGVVLLDSSKREVIVDAFRSGAKGVFSRHESLETLCKCVRCVHEGQVWANSQQMSYAVDALASSPTVRAVDANGLSLLSKREMEVVNCLTEGMTNKEIAERLGLSQHTIKNYLFRVFDKLGVSNRMELMFLTLSQPASAKDASAGSKSKNNGEEEDTFVWRQKAAEQGTQSAQIALAEMYWHGKGATKDVVVAYMWYLISEKNNLEIRDQISSAKRKLADELSTEQILEAQRKAMEHGKKNGKPSSERAAQSASRAGQ